MLSAELLHPDHRVLRFRIQPHRSGKLAVIDPVPEHELVLVLDARVDEIAEQPTLDSVIGLGGIIGRPVWQASADQAVRVVAPAGLTLARNRLATGIDPTHVRADGTTQTLRIARTIRVHVFEVIELLRRQSALRTIAVRRQCKWDTIAPSPTYLGGEQLGIDLVLVRLKESSRIQPRPS